MFGVLWMFLSPLLMLAIFAFVFGHIFPARWPHQETGTPFWLLLYSGLITFNVFAETVSRSPASVRGYPSFALLDPNGALVAISAHDAIIEKDKSIAAWVERVVPRAR